MKINILSILNKSENILSIIHGKALDYSYAFLVHKLLPVTGSFFSKGWGNISKTNWLKDRNNKVPWPPNPFKVVWKCIKNGKYENVKYKIFEGIFDTPCTETVLDALPKESHKGRVQLLFPIGKSSKQLSLVLHLAGTGDHGFGRRLRIGRSLLNKNIASIILESPYYGKRRPFYQRGSKLIHVSDLLTLGRATIEESLSILHWATKRNFKSLCVSGISMGGVHACMIASLYPDDIACAPFLTPRSAAVAFCEGVLHYGIKNWENFLIRTDDTNNDINNTLLKQEENQRTIEEIKSCFNFKSDVPWYIENIEMDKVDDASYSKILSNHDSFYHHFYPDDLTSDLSLILPVATALQKYKAQRQLQIVLEMFTNVTSFPMPRRTDAVIFVSAINDAYVSPKSTEAIHRHWKGSELRWIPGGHVSSFLFHDREFSRAIIDSLLKINLKNK